MSWSSQGAPRPDQSGSYNPVDDLALIGPKRSRSVLVIVIAALAGAATCVGLLHLLDRAPVKTVPALVGFSAEHARGMAKKLGLGLLVVGARPDPLVTRGSVAAQDPLAKRTLRQGNAIIVVLSSGKPQARPVASAPRGTRPSGSLRSDVSPPPSASEQAAAKAAAKAPQGKLSWSEEPQGGKAAPKAPTAAGLVSVPRVIKNRLGYARRKLGQAGLRVGRVRHRTDEDQMAGRILSQKPRAGKKVPRGSAVDLVVNRYED